MSTKKTRRAFIKDVGLVGGAWAVSTSGLDSAAGSGGGRSRVAISRGLDVAGMTRKSIDALGGMGQFISPGDRVFIKPNFCTSGNEPGIERDPKGAGEITDPRIVAMLAELCLEQGAKRVVIGEGAGHFAVDFERIGMQSLVDALNEKHHDKVQCVDLKEDHLISTFKTDRDKTGLSRLAVWHYLAESDKVLSAAVMKCHHDCGITGTVKNFVGTIPLNVATSPRMKAHWRWRTELHSRSIDEVICALNENIRPVLGVLDMSVALEADGPMECFGGKTIDVSRHIGDYLMVASGDLTAADATATRLIGLDLDNPITHLQKMNAYGLGKIGEADIELVGDVTSPEAVKQIAAQWHKGEPREGMWEPSHNYSGKNS